MAKTTGWLFWPTGGRMYILVCGMNFVFFLIIFVFVFVSLFAFVVLVLFCFGLVCFVIVLCALARSFVCRFGFGCLFVCLFVCLNTQIHEDVIDSLPSSMFLFGKRELKGKAGGGIYHFVSGSFGTLLAQ
jgi:hypothetical protein